MIIFNEHQRRQIETNPDVISVSDRSIQYTVEFKLMAVQENLNGKGPSEIFKDAGFGDNSASNRRIRASAFSNFLLADKFSDRGRPVLPFPRRSSVNPFIDRFFPTIIGRWRS